MSQHLVKFLERYGHAEERQDFAESATDSQIKSLALFFASRLAASTDGTIIDIGCGNGVLLNRLAQLSDFRASEEWNYVGVDEKDALGKVIGLAFEQGLNKRVDLITLEDFYGDIPMPIPEAGERIIVVRNVLHELDAEQTARLFCSLQNLSRANDAVLIQDILVFPKAERGNACWDPESLELLVSSLGWKSVLTVEPSKSGNSWINVILQRQTNDALSYERVLKSVYEARKSQWIRWTSLGLLSGTPLATRDQLIARIDLDLQYAALTKQLAEASQKVRKFGNSSGPDFRLSDTQQSQLAQEAFFAQIDVFDAAALSPAVPTPISYFRDRARNQDALERFLVSNHRIAVVRGGPYSGKSVLVDYVLSRRAHTRRVIKLDVLKTASVWNLVELYLFELGLPVQSDILKSLSDIEFSDVIDVLAPIVDAAAERTVVVFDHFENLLDPAGSIFDDEIRQFLDLLGKSERAKIVVTSRQEIRDKFPKLSWLTEVEQPIVGRFPEGVHVTNVLDDFVDRSSEDIEEYPADLLSAIDRHPYLAWIAAQVIRQEGKESLDDRTLFEQLRQRLRDELVARLVTHSVHPLVLLARLFRRPVPRIMMMRLFSREVVEEAEAIGLLYRTPDPSPEPMVSLIGALRGGPSVRDAAPNDRPDSSTDVELHDRIANELIHEYRIAHDPRFLREATYHGILAGHPIDTEALGVNWKTELSWAGEYWFIRQKDYTAARWAFERAIALGVTDPKVRLRLSACLMRNSESSQSMIEQGVAGYQALFDEFPEWTGAKLSLVDSQIFVGDYEGALKSIEQYGLSPKIDPWVSGQLGRIALNQHRYVDAVEHFNRQLTSGQEVPVVLLLAQCYRRLGEWQNEMDVLARALKSHPDHKVLQISLAHCLGRSYEQADVDAAIEKLMTLHSATPAYGRILYPLVKCLCRRGRIEEAKSMSARFVEDIYPVEFRKAIDVTILKWTGEFSAAAEILGRPSPNDVNGVGMLKDVYLNWAKSVEDSADRIRLADMGLRVPVDAGLSENFPILITDARLANLAGNEERFDLIRKRCERLNIDLDTLVKSTSVEGKVGSELDDPLIDELLE